jgi:anti-sigma B factor antagonist
VEQEPEPLTVRVNQDEAGVTVEVDGDLDLSTARHLLERAIGFVDGAAPATMTVNLSGVGFCDSAGISVLVLLRQRCEESGWRFQVVGTQDRVRRMLVDFTGLGDYLNVA